MKLTVSFFLQHLRFSSNLGWCLASQEQQCSAMRQVLGQHRFLGTSHEGQMLSLPRGMLQMRHMRRPTHQRRPFWNVWGRRLLSNSLPRATRPTIFPRFRHPKLLRMWGWWTSPSVFPSFGWQQWHGKLTLAAPRNIARLWIPHRHQYFSHHQKEARPTETWDERGRGQQIILFSLHRPQHRVGGKDQKGPDLL